MQSSMIKSVTEDFGNGGTIDGDITITGDLQVDGGGSLSFDEIVQGTQVIDVTNTEALLVRKNDDGGDVFIVDTTNSRVGIGVVPTHNLNVYNGSGSSSMTLGKYASGKTVALLGTSADTSGYFQIQSYASQGSTFGNIALNAQGGNVGIGRSTNIDKKLHILSSTSGDGITLEQSSVGSNAIRFEANSSALRGLFGSEDSDGGAILSGTSGYSMVLRSESDIFLATNGNNEALKIDTSQNATFAGTISSNIISITTDGGAVGGDFNGTTVGRGQLHLNRDDTTTTKQIQFYKNGSEHSYLETSTSGLNIGGANVGIGTSSPTGILSIFRDDSSTVGTNDVIIENDGSGDASLKFSLTGATDWYAYVDNSDSDKFKIRRSTTDHFTIDESGNATFGGNVIVGSGSGATAFSTADNLSIHGSGDSGINILSGSTSNGSLMFGDSEDNNVGQVDYDHANNTMSFITGASTALSINSSGLATFGGTVLIDGVSNYTGLEIKGAGGARPSIKLSNVNNGVIGSIYGTEGNALIFSSGTGGATSLTLDSSQNATFAGDVFIKNSGSNDPSTLSLWSSDTSIADDDNIGVILAQGSDSGGSPPYTGAKIEFNADATWDTGTSNYYATRIDFFTQSDNGTDTLATSALSINRNKAVFFGKSTVTGSGTASIIHASNDYMYIKGGSSGLILGDDIANSNIQINNDGSIYQIVAGNVKMHLDTNSRISLSNNDSGSGNTIFGKNASTSQAGSNNTIIGENTALAMDGGEAHNIAIGNNAMRGSDEGASGNIDFNVAVGSSALYGGILSGTDQVTGNIAIGYQSLFKADDTNGSVGQVAIGYQSLKALTSGVSNTAVGYQTGNDITIGSNNTILGYQAGATGTHDITGGSNNTLIGMQSKTSNANASNQTVIGKGASGVADNSVTLGNGDVTAVYMAQDSGASIFCGDILSGRASSGSTGNGHAIRSADSAIFSRDAGGETMQVCRNADNGQFIQFRANGSIVGDIKNTGGTVSLTGFSGCHESSSSDTLEVGMVVSTIDEEHSENHAKVEISNSVGDKRVYGVVSDLEGLDGSNVTIASVGISSIKVTGSCVGGDLLESNGDGTAKVQSDDIIRSKTLGKVTMGNSTEEVKMVSCVLYCG